MILQAARKGSLLFWQTNCNVTVFFNKPPVWCQACAERHRSSAPKRIFHVGASWPQMTLVIEVSFVLGTHGRCQFPFVPCLSATKPFGSASDMGGGMHGALLEVVAARCRKKLRLSMVDQSTVCFQLCHHPHTAMCSTETQSVAPAILCTCSFGGATSW